jgi:hypothetical protein
MGKLVFWEGAEHIAGGNGHRECGWQSRLLECNVSCFLATVTEPSTGLTPLTQVTSCREL